MNDDGEVLCYSSLFQVNKSFLAKDKLFYRASLFFLFLSFSLSFFLTNFPRTFFLL